MKKCISQAERDALEFEAEVEGDFYRARAALSVQCRPATRTHRA